jgi:LemA protein
MTSVLFTVAVLAAVLFWFGVIYRRTLRLRLLVSHAWKRLDELVKRRIEVVGQTLEVARSAGIQGVELDRLIHAHGQATPYRGPSDAAARTAHLDHALNGLLSLMGQHTGAGGALRAISENLDAVTRAVSEARDAYNDRAISYNRTIGALPGNLIAGMAGFHRAELFA